MIFSKKIWALLLISLTPISSESMEQYPTEVTGATLNIIQSPIFYTEYVPLLFEISHDRDINIKLRDTPRCYNYNESIAPRNPNTYSRMVCSIAEPMNSFINEYYNQIKVELIFMADEKDSVPTLDCKQIVPHFRKFSLTLLEFNNYLLALKSCPLKAFQKKELLSSIMVNNTQLEYMLSRYKSAIFPSSAQRQLESQELLGLYFNGYLIFQSIGLLNGFIAHEKKREPLSLCKSNLIPQPLVNIKEFSNGLAKLNVTLKNSGYAMSVAYSDMDLYYGLKLTECGWLFNESIFIVKSLIPIRPVKRDFKLLEIKVIPFGVDLNSSRESNLVCRLKDVEGRYITDGSFITRSKCQSNKLCHIEESFIFDVDPCVTAIYNNDIKDVQRYCKIRCIYIPTNNFPLIVQTKPDQFIVVGMPHSNPKFDIFLANQETPIKVLKPVVTGALEVNLACGWRISYNNQTFKANFPCGKEHLVRKIQPVGFVRHDDNEDSKASEILLLKKELDELKDRIDNGVHYGFIWGAIIISGLCACLALIVSLNGYFSEFRLNKVGNSRRAPGPITKPTITPDAHFANNPHYDSVHFQKI